MNINDLNPNDVKPVQVEQATTPALNINNLNAEDVTVLSPEEVAAEPYQTPGQQALAGLEAAGRGASFGISTAIERGLGVKAKDIRAREEHNPEVALIGEIAGIGASSLIPGTGPLQLLERAGAGAAKAVGLSTGLHASAPLIQKMGASAVNQAVQGALIGSGQEVHRYFAQDPTQSVASALTNIGTAAALTGGLGAAGSAALHPLRAAANTQRVKSLLEGVKGNLQNQAGLEEVNKLSQQAGVELPQAVKGAMSGADANQSAAILKHSNSLSADQARAELQMSERNLADAVVQSTGRTAEELPSLEHLSEYETGKELKDSMKEGLERYIKPLSEQFKPIEEKFSTVALPDTAKATLSDKISQIGLEGGHFLRPDSDAAKELNNILRDIKNIKTLEDMRKFQSSVREDLGGKGLYNLNRQVMGALRESEGNVLTDVVSAEAPELLHNLKRARRNYGEVMDKLDDLNDRIKVGKYYGPDSFLKALEEMEPEQLLRRSQGLKDVEFIKFLGDTLPQAKSIVSKYHVDKLLKSAHMAPGAPEGGINTRKFFSMYDKLSPELKQSLLRPDQLQQLDSARTLDQIQKASSHGILSAVVGLVTGHVGAALSVPLIARLLNEAPDAVRLGMLRIAGTTGEASVPGFTNLAKFANNMQKGHNLIKSATSAVFKDTAVDILPKSKVPTPQSRAKLESILKKVAMDPVGHSDALSKSMGQYLDTEMGVVGMTMARAVNFLAPLKPEPKRLGPLDPPAPISSTEQARYDRALNIVEQPLVVLQHIKQGSLTVEDVATINAVHPELAQQFRDKLFEKMTDQRMSGKIPHKVAMSMSLFLGQPLEASLQPMNIASIQAVAQQVTQQRNQIAQQGMKVNGQQGKALNDLPKLAATGAQAREQTKGQKA